MHLLNVKNLRVRFETHHGTVNAVDGVSFHLEEGETLGLVGESGSGKSVTNLALMGLIPSPPGVVVAESMMYGKRNLMKLSDAELRAIRGNEIAMIFQDPMTSLNPLLTIERQLTEVLMLHKGKSRSEARKLAAAGLGDVGIPHPEARLDAFPHELSGGMRQRVMIAMGLLCKPRILIADEPTTALDVTIQAQILELMKDMQKKYGMAIIMVTHDLGVVAGMTDRINVMYAGRIAETAQVDDLFARPKHPYTQGLLASVPRLDGNPDDDLYSIQGAPPDLASLPKGCSFGPRCSQHTARCDQDKPTLRQLDDEVSGKRRRVACVAVEISDDPNKELFAELERQEREGSKGGMTWTPKAAAGAAAVAATATADEAPEDASSEPATPADEPVATPPDDEPLEAAPEASDAPPLEAAEPLEAAAEPLETTAESLETTAAPTDDEAPDVAAEPLTSEPDEAEPEAPEDNPLHVEEPSETGINPPPTPEAFQDEQAHVPTLDDVPAELEPEDLPSLPQAEPPPPRVNPYDAGRFQPKEDAHFVKPRLEDAAPLGADDPFALAADEDESLEEALDLDSIEAAESFEGELDMGDWKVFGGPPEDDEKQADDPEKNR